ncbi:MAG TPA: transglycosylase SLT domain-containing protein [Gemmatimonadales bacterium]|nr:transglycosylase SLT domain-containing protein [Gemmatimonadales bacterium]
MERLIAHDRTEPLTLPVVLTRGGIILLAAVAVSTLAGALGGAPPAPAPALPAVTAPSAEATALQAELDQARGALAVERLKNRRGDAIQAYSATYRIPADLAASIYDHAVTEGLDPALAFRLVRVESNFRQGVQSRARAIGYTQLKLGTARHYEPWVTERDLRSRDVNLRIGFRFLRDLMRQYGGDEQLALLAYNRGPARVNEYLDNRGDPDNGYAQAVLGAGHPGRP